MRAHKNFLATATGVLAVETVPDIDLRVNFSVHTVGVTDVYVSESDGYLVFQVVGLTTGTLALEASLDGGTTWVALELIPAGGGAGVTSVTAVGMWRTAIPYGKP